MLVCKCHMSDYKCRFWHAKRHFLCFHAVIDTVKDISVPKTY